MSEAVNTVVENTEKSSVNKFDRGYKKLVVIKKCLVQVVDSNDSKEIGTSKRTFDALLKNSVPFPLFTLAVQLSSQRTSGNPSGTTFLLEFS